MYTHNCEIHMSVHSCVRPQLWNKYECTLMCTATIEKYIWLYAHAYDHNSEINTTVHSCVRPQLWNTYDCTLMRTATIVKYIRPYAHVYDRNCEIHMTVCMCNTSCNQTHHCRRYSVPKKVHDNYRVNIHIFFKKSSTPNHEEVPRCGSTGCKANAINWTQKLSVRLGMKQFLGTWC